VGPVNDWAQIRAGSVLYEDDAALVLNKPAGLAVMGERHDTDLVRLAEEAGEKLYPAHRIDKVTSGVLLLAKDLGLHGDLTRQFNRRTVDKVYLAITGTTGLPARGTIELPLSVGRKNRVRVAANRAAISYDPAGSRWSVAPEEQFQEVRSYPSATTFLTVTGDAEHTLLAVSPVTGRRHQIRVHLAWIGHPIEGDPLFGRAGPGRAAPGRTLLHSWRLGFDAAWDGGRRIKVEAPPGPDFWAALPGGAVPLPDWDATSGH
jgi:tRNA pseudouridine32 synthase/23S rRNA pseudouridine746 synthase/23S rRNA pseudouridine1911/1915/1917 synthase